MGDNMGIKLLVLLLLLFGCVQQPPMPPIPPEPPPEPPEVSDLLGLYHFESNAIDSSGSGHSGTIEGANCGAGVEGKIGSGCVFDGNDRIVLGQIQELKNAESYTIMGWVKDTGGISIRQGTIVSQAGVGLDNFHFKMMFEFPEPGFKFKMSTDIGNEIEPVHAVTNEDLMQWNHVAVVYTGRTGIIYVNGVETVYRVIYASDVSPSISAPVVIGGSDQTDLNIPDGWIGFIDEVKIYNRALTKQEIEAIRLQEV